MVTIKNIVHFFYRMTTLISFKETIITLTNRFDKSRQYVFLISLLMLSLSIGIGSFLYMKTVLSFNCVLVLFVAFFNIKFHPKVANDNIPLDLKLRLKIHEFAKKNTIWFLLIIISIIACWAFVDIYFKKANLIFVAGICMIILLSIEGFTECVGEIFLEKICRLNNPESEKSIWKIILYCVLYMILSCIIGVLIGTYYLFCTIFFIAIVCSSNTIFLLNYLTPNYMKELDFDVNNTSAYLNLNIPIWSMLLYMIAFGSTLTWLLFAPCKISELDILVKKDTNEETPENI